MVYNGMELGSFFEIPWNSPCYQVLRGINPILQMIFTFSQLYFTHTHTTMIKFFCHSDFLEDYSANSGCHRWHTVAGGHLHLHQSGDVIVPSAHLLTSSTFAMTFFKQSNGQHIRRFCSQKKCDNF